MSDVTLILERVSKGDPKAAEELLPLVYDELRQVAAAKLAREPQSHTLQATALVHEAWLRVRGASGWHSRAHFFAAAAEAMRRILVERARRRATAKHGSNPQFVELAEDQIQLDAPPDEIVAVNEALESLERCDPAAAELIKLRYFVGLTVPEIAELTGVSTSSVDRTWAYARAWLKRAMLHPGPAPPKNISIS